MLKHHDLCHASLILLLPRVSVTLISMHFMKEDTKFGENSRRSPNTELVEKSAGMQTQSCLCFFTWLEIPSYRWNSVGGKETLIALLVWPPPPILQPHMQPRTTEIQFEFHSYFFHFLLTNYFFLQPQQLPPPLLPVPLHDPSSILSSFLFRKVQASHVS